MTSRAVQINIIFNYLKYCFCPSANLTSGICQASTNSDVFIDSGCTVVVIQTQLAVEELLVRVDCDSKNMNQKHIAVRKK